MADDAKGGDAVVQPVESAALERRQSRGQNAGARAHPSRHPLGNSERQAVHEQVTQPHPGCIGDDFVDRHSDDRVVRTQDGADAGSDQDLNRQPRRRQPPQHTEVRGASKAAGAENDAESWPAHGA